jgi:hypothetical protein
LLRPATLTTIVRGMGSPFALFRRNTDVTTRREEWK